MTVKIKELFFLLSVILFFNCDLYNKKDIPHDLDSAIEYLMENWSEYDKDCFKNEEETKAVNECHMTIGMGLRNNWGLWTDNELSMYFKKIGVSHADDKTNIILTTLHRKLNGRDIKLEEQIKKFEIKLIAEKMPTPPNGIDGVENFIDEHFIYSQEIIDLNLNGKVYVNFVVNKDGSFSDIKVVKSLHPLIDKECVRVTKLFPAWIPGEHMGEKVRVRYNLPFEIKVQ